MGEGAQVCLCVCWGQRRFMVADVIIWAAVSCQSYHWTNWSDWAWRLVEDTMNQCAKMLSESNCAAKANLQSETATLVKLLVIGSHSFPRRSFPSLATTIGIVIWGKNQALLLEQDVSLCARGLGPSSPWSRTWGWTTCQDVLAFLSYFPSLNHAFLCLLLVMLKAISISSNTEDPDPQRMFHINCYLRSIGTKYPKIVEWPDRAKHDIFFFLFPPNHNLFFFFSDYNNGQYVCTL